MISASRSLRQARSSGTPLPVVPALAELYNFGVMPRSGQLIMLAGRSGSQKSGFAMWLVSQWGLPTLYISADMSQYTAASRLASIATGKTSEEIADELSDDGTALEISEVLRKSPIDFVFSSQPSLDDIDEEVDAWVELRDEYPAIIVIDNLLDMEPLNENEFASGKAILLELKSLVRRTGCTVLVLHHNKTDGIEAYPAPLKGIQGKLDQTAELVLSIALEEGTGDTRIFRISPVKNRSGAASPSAEKYIELIATPNRTAFRAKSFYG